MNPENEEKETRVKRIPRIALRPQTEKILEDWQEQLQQLFPAFDPSLSDLISWGVERSPVLSKKEIQEIKARFYDDVKELESLLLRLRKARVGGDVVAVSELLSTITIRRKSIETQPTQLTEK
jgi:hypothetical protein